jgi:hypothetical protein
MNRNNKIYAVVVAFLAAFTFAATTSALAQDPQHERKASIAAGRSSTVPGVSQTNQFSYQIGKDFAMAIEDAKTMKDDSESFNFTIVDLVYLIDGLEGQAEAVQLQAILKGVIRGTKDLTAVSREISAISNTYLARQTAEQKWYFNVGSVQMNLMYAGWSKDAVGATKNTKELQALVKTAPVGTPALVLEAIKGLAKYATMAQLTVNDFSDIVDDAKLITTIVYA